jgi:hypothetical protein
LQRSDSIKVKHKMCTIGSVMSFPNQLILSKRKDPPELLSQKALVKDTFRTDISILSSEVITFNVN